jgi:hypothetical protein
MAMEQKRKEPVEPEAAKPQESRDSEQLDPCERERVEAEMANSKPGASGLGLRSATSKC